MSIIQRGRRFHYRFMVDGVVYSGLCNVPAVPGNATPEQIAELRTAAEKFEADEKNGVTQNLHKLREKDKEVRMNKSVVALIENYKFELSPATSRTLVSPISFKAASCSAPFRMA